MRVFPYNLEEAKKLLSSPDTYAFVLMSILLTKYDTSFLEEEDSSAVIKSVEEDFNIHLPLEAENRINAAIQVLSSDLPYISFPVFKACALAFAEGQIGDEEDAEDDELNTCELLWGLYEMALLEGKTVEEIEGELSDEVVAGLNRIIDGEAEDEEDEEDEEDGVEEVNEVARDPYYRRYVRASTEELVRQLQRLGVPASTCAEILMEYNGLGR